MNTKWSGLAVIAMLACQPTCVLADDDAESSLPGLLKLYQKVGLPLPPKNAKLVRTGNGGGNRSNGVLLPEEFSLGFLFKSQETQGTVYLEGTNEYPYEASPKCKEIEPTKTAAKETFGFRPNIVMAVQCQFLGWSELATDILSSSRKISSGSPRSEILSNAWYVWTQRILDPKSDRRPISAMLKWIMAHDNELATKQNKSLVHSLDLAMAKSQAKPGTTLALIDSLVDVTNTDTGSGFRTGVEARNSSYWQLVRLGFDAVPALLEHLEDNRLTRTYRPWFTGSSGRTGHLLVSDLAAELLEELAGSQTSNYWRKCILEDFGANEPLVKSDVLAWWREAKKVGEKPYLVRNVLQSHQSGKNSGMHFTPEWPNEHQLYVLGSKYPQELEAIYKGVLKKQPLVDSWPVVREIVASNLSASEKIRLLQTGVAAKDPEHQATAIGQLLELDHEEAVAILTKILAVLPSKLQASQPSGLVGQLAFFVVKADDARSWQALTRIATKADPLVRIEILDRMIYAETRSTRRLDFIAGFLADTGVRELKAQGGFPRVDCAFSDFKKLEVRNAAAMALACILKMTIQQPVEEWQKEDWAKLQKQVREQLIKNGVEALSG